MAKSLASISAAVQEKADVSELREGDRTITVFAPKEPGRGISSICCTIDGDDLIFSLNPLALRGELQRRAAKTDRLDQSPAYAAARSRVTGNPQVLYYFDVQALAGAAYNIFVPMTQMSNDPKIAEFRKNMDVNALPPAGALTRHLESATMSQSNDEAGILIEYRTPTGIVGPIIPISVVGGFYARRAMMMRMQGMERAVNPGKAVPPPKPPEF
jgi:hypothetical protein